MSARQECDHNQGAGWEDSKTPETGLERPRNVQELIEFIHPGIAGSPIPELISDLIRDCNPFRGTDSNEGSLTLVDAAASRLLTPNDAALRVPSVADTIHGILFRESGSLAMHSMIGFYSILEELEKGPDIDIRIGLLDIDVIGGVIRKYYGNMLSALHAHLGQPKETYYHAPPNPNNYVFFGNDSAAIHSLPKLRRVARGGIVEDEEFIVHRPDYFIHLDHHAVPCYRGMFGRFSHIKSHIYLQLIRTYNSSFSPFSPVVIDLGHSSDLRSIRFDLRDGVFVCQKQRLTFVPIDSDNSLYDISADHLGLHAPDYMLNAEDRFGTVRRLHNHPLRTMVSALRMTRDALVTMPEGKITDDSFLENNTRLCYAMTFKLFTMEFFKHKFDIPHMAWSEIYSLLVQNYFINPEMTEHILNSIGFTRLFKKHDPQETIDNCRVLLEAQEGDPKPPIYRAFRKFIGNIEIPFL